jgi:broad specificity phosphatase PhoE
MVLRLAGNACMNFTFYRWSFLHRRFFCLDFKMIEQKWPDMLWVVRHGQSAGNVARDLAEAGGQSLIDIAERDVDVPLSTLGQQQAEALGIWLGNLVEAERPSAVLCSPYIRARQTARIAIDAGGIEDIAFVVDERLREKEFGILDRFTKLGIQQQYRNWTSSARMWASFIFARQGAKVGAM